MAQDFSFDVVSEVDRNEVRNAVNLAQKEIATRYDFKKSVSKVDSRGRRPRARLRQRGQAAQVVDVLEDKLVRRKVPLKALQYGKIEAALGGTVRQHVTITHGIPDEKAKAVSKLIRQQLQEGQGADPGRRRARLLAQARTSSRRPCRRCATRTSASPSSSRTTADGARRERS